ncbi:MAG: hypothetical protein HQ521_11930 [Bacteroidetes bacterium]|nr:hypothetical protein [Bacteroidota bacterium]
MKKIVLLIFVLAVFAACQKTDPIAEMGMDDEMALKAAKVKAIDLNGAHFELNLLGKKDGWNDKEVDNPSRHTMFIPRNTEGWSFDLKTPNNIGEETLPGIRIDMSQGEEFAVLDGTVFDGDGCEFQLGKGKYVVYVAMRGKKNVDPAEIAAWLEALETTTIDGTVTEELWYYQKLGDVSVTRKWTNITDLFTITESEAGALPWEIGVNDPVWIFDYMDWLGDQEIVINIGTEEDPIWETTTYSELAYFWQLQNNGSQLIKVRFYPI